jgi:hypothetical protein
MTLDELNNNLRVLNGAIGYLEYAEFAFRSRFPPSRWVSFGFKVKKAIEAEIVIKNFTRLLPTLPSAGPNSDRWPSIFGILKRRHHEGTGLNFSFMIAGGPVWGDTK